MQEREGSGQTVLCARRAPTIKPWSFDARSEGQSGHSPCRCVKKTECPLQCGRESEKKGREVWRFPVLAQRAVADSHRWTRARRESARPSPPSSLKGRERKEGSVDAQTLRWTRLTQESRMSLFLYHRRFSTTPSMMETWHVWKPWEPSTVTAEDQASLAVSPTLCLRWQHSWS